MGLPRINVLQIDGHNALGRSRVTLEDGTVFENYVILRQVDGEDLFEVEMPSGIFKGKKCLLQPEKFNRFVPNEYDNAW